MNIKTSSPGALRSQLKLEMHAPSAKGGFLPVGSSLLHVVRCFRRFWRHDEAVLQRCARNATTSSILHLN